MTQAITSGLLDNVARLLPPRTLLSDKSVAPRAAYFSCWSAISQPLFIDQKSVLFDRDFRNLSQWMCYDTVVRKATKDGSSISTMTNVTPIDPSWLGEIAQESKLLFLGDVTTNPPPKYNADVDQVVCSVVTKYGDRGWPLPPIEIEMKEATRLEKKSGTYATDDMYRWFARYLLEDKVIRELSGLGGFFNVSEAKKL